MKLENFKNGYDVTLGSSLAVNEKNDCSVREQPPLMPACDACTLVDSAADT